MVTGLVEKTARVVAFLQGGSACARPLSAVGHGDSPSAARVEGWIGPFDWSEATRRLTGFSAHGPVPLVNGGVRGAREGVNLEFDLPGKYVEKLLPFRAH